MYDNLKLLQKRDSVKNSMMDLLCKNIMLRTNSIHLQLKTSYNLDVSYQAVHKAIHEMVDQNIISRSGKAIMLNSEWLDGVENFVQQAKLKHYNHFLKNLPGLKDVKNLGLERILQFNSFYDVDNYRIRLTSEYISNKSEKAPFIIIAQHLRSAIVYGERTIDVMNSAKKTGSKIDIVIAGDTKLDRYCKDYYNKTNITRIKLSTVFKKHEEVYVFGDMILTVIIPRKISAKFDMLYKKARTVSDIYIPDFFMNVMMKKDDFKCILKNDPKEADRIRQWVNDKLSNE